MPSNTACLVDHDGLIVVGTGMLVVDIGWLVVDIDLVVVGIGLKMVDKTFLTIFNLQSSIFKP